ncbi:hypothetical protein [Roseovarius sp. MMSF_3281]|uniref:hypothetical protein n=1 Tax=Roseovarius sp. MMSF_3281 TaxID=3046694 RepID=UPI00274007D6|nr:hypothetical protein [Roseovarius sp. MMSF_3281]
MRFLRKAAWSENDIDALSKRILLPSLPVSDEEMARATHQDRGQKLARQEMWTELSKQIQYADDCRLSTPGGEIASMLLAFGARSDVVAAAEDAILDGVFPDPAGMKALEEVQAEHYGDPYCALVVAMAHVDIGWAWRNAARDGIQKQEDCQRQWLAHFKRARDILAPHDGIELDAPSLAAAQCALTAAFRQKAHRVADDYEKLIDLDPDGHRHMRALGQHLLPAHFGSYEALELEARRTASRTGDVWREGAYAWVYFDALAMDRGALDLLDAEFFADGIRHILEAKKDQHITNLWAAFCAVTMAPNPEKRLSGRAEATRQRLHDCLDWVLSDYLQELHPLIWSQALLSPGLTPTLPSRRALINKGRQTALRIIATRFADELAEGTSIAFSAAGMYRLPSL